jgi:hypothetical protein
MLVFDLPHGDAKERVAAIGCCRVNMPIKRMGDHYPVDWIWRDSMFAHTTSHAEQYLRFTREQTAIPPFIERCIYQPAPRTTPPGDPAEFVASFDTFMVEISDLRLMWAGPWALQQNMVVENLVRPHGETLLPWWMEVCRYGFPQPETVERVVTTLRALDLEHWDEIEFLVREFRQRQQDRQMLISAVEALVDEYPGRWILIPNIVIDNEDGQRMDQRRDLRVWLKDAATLVGAEFFDPAPLIAKAGRKNALDLDGTNLNHYSDSFYNTIGDAYLDILLHGRSALAVNA